MPISSKTKSPQATKTCHTGLAIELRSHLEQRTGIGGIRMQ